MLADVVVVLLAAGKVVGTVSNLTVVGVPDDLAHECLPSPNVGLLLRHLALREAQLIDLVYSQRNVSLHEVSRDDQWNVVLRIIFQVSIVRILGDGLATPWLLHLIMIDCGQFRRYNRINSLLKRHHYSDQLLRP